MPATNTGSKDNPKPKNNPTRKTWSRKVDETGSSGDYATFLRQQEDNRKRQLHTDIQHKLDADAQRRFNQERDVLMATYNKLRENPSLLDDKPEAMKAFNTLLGKYGMPEYNKDTFISNLNRNNNQQINNSFKNNIQQNQNQYQNINQQTRGLPEGTYDSRIKWTPGNFGYPFTAPSVSNPSTNLDGSIRPGSQSPSPHTSSGR